MDVIVGFEAVSKRFGAVQAVDRLSFTVRRGELVGLIGPDGAGKTTTIRLIGGLVAPDSGRVEVFGLDPARSRRALADSLGYLSQGSAIYGDLTVDENIAFFAELHGRFDYRARRERLLDLMGLRPARARLADQLSGGMRQKLALACALVHEPALLLLDEPTTGVDPVSRRELWKLLWEFLADGIAIVLATAYLEEAERCSRVVLLHEGRLLAFDEPARLTAAFEHDLVEIVASPLDAARQVVASSMPAGGIEIFGDRLHVRVAKGTGPEQTEALARQLRAAGLVVLDVRPGAPSLEDVFIDRIQPLGRSAPSGVPSSLAS